MTVVIISGVVYYYRVMDNILSLKASHCIYLVVFENLQ